MLNSILSKRYKKVLISIFILIIGLYSFWGISLTKAWHQTEAYTNTEEFKEEYLLQKEYSKRIYTDNNGIGRSLTLDEMKINRLTIFYHIGDEEQLYEIYNVSKHSPQEYTIGTPYLQNKLDYRPVSDSGTFPSIFLLFIALISGFLIFFIYLFSLGVSHRQIFKAKILRIALPIFSSFAVGSLLYTLILQISIPKPYLNVTLGQMFYSSLSHLSLIALFLSIGILLGTLLGNIVFAPLTVLLGFITLLLINAPYYGLQGIILGHTTKTDLPIFESLFVPFPGKTGALIVSNIIIWLIILLCLLIAKKAYPHTSLENDNDYLLIPQSKFPYFLFLATSMSIYTVLAINVWGRWLSPDRFDIPLSSAIVASIIWIIISVTTMFILVYFSSLKKWFKHRLMMK